MSFTRSSLRYAHTTGYTSLLFTPNGKFIITCGSDGDIRNWTCISDDDPSSTCLGEFVMCIAHTGSRLLASTDRNTVQAYTYPSMDNDGILMRFTAPVTCLRVSGAYTAAGGEDTLIKVLRSYNTVTEMVLEGHTGPVLALDLYAKRQLLSSIGGDGQLKVWNLETGAELKSIGGLPRVNSFESASLFGTPSFEPQLGEHLAYAQDKEIIVLNTANWEIAYKLCDDRISSNYSCCQFSPNGKKLAAGTTGGELSVFDVQRLKALKVEAPPNDCKAITSIAWNTANEDELAFCDASGQLGTIFLVNEPTTEDVEADGVEEDNLLGNDLIDFDLDDYKSIGNMDGDSSDGRTSKLISDKEFDDEPLVSKNVISMPKMFKAQAAFQPSATPKDLEHRYLVWNDVGIVTAHTELNGDGAIDVEFHDASVHHTLHISNYNQHNMASLSRSALALAATDSSKLVVIALAAAGNKEWSLNLPDCESVEAIVATSDLVAVATSAHFLRLFSVMGTQREVLSVPGPVVALAGHESSLLSVYHSAGPSQNQQHLTAMLINVSGLTLRVEQLLMPLTPGRQLSWLGYSDVGSPTFVDNMGLVQLYRQRSNAWFPICDTMKQSSSVSHNYFIISLSERSQIIQAVLCRGTSYPMTNPRPMLHELHMQLPLCDIELEKSELEDTLIRASIMQIEGAEKMQKETALKLFALACGSECETRARELIETIACTELLQLAAKYAMKRGRIHMSDRLCELMPRLEAIQEARKQQQLLRASGIAATIVLPMAPTATGTASKLAPKAMELSASKRGVLKRFSNSPSLFKSSATSCPSTPESTAVTLLDTQENIFGEPASHGLSERGAKQMTALDATPDQRTPLNSVNPFAMKRKLGDTGVIFGSEKLKFAKK